MSADSPPTDTSPKLGWRFPQTFWVANGAELFERAAFYGMFITLAHYLTSRLGFSDIWAALVVGGFSGIIYLLPTFLGAMADKIGFKRALMLAFALLTVGYALLGAAGADRSPGRAASTPFADPVAAESAQQRPPANLGPGATQGQGPRAETADAPLKVAAWRKTLAVAALVVIMFGGAIVKPVISGTAAKCSDEDHRARAFSIFYWMVNIGAFTGKAVAAPLRQQLGLEYINFYAALMAFCAFVLVALVYRDVGARGGYQSPGEAWQGLVKVVTNFRFMALILIVAGFWLIQGQLYASMTKYILRLLGDTARPEWLANVNPLVVIVLVVPITHLVRKARPENCIGIGLFIIPFTALVIGTSPLVESALGSSIRIAGQLSIHPITLVVILGVGLQGLAECFLSPKFLEYASKQAPKGEEGLYLGYQHLTTFIAWLVGFIMSGFLLDAYCPDPEKLRLADPAAYQQWLTALETGGPLPEAYAHANVMWFWFAGVGVCAFVALLIFKYVTNRIDQARAAA